LSSIEVYNKIYTENIGQIRSGNIEVDHFLATGENDSRRGISLIVPVKQILNNYKRLVGDFSTVEPDQFYYPFEDLHITVFDFVQGTVNYQRNDLLEGLFLRISQNAIDSMGNFKIQMKGIVYSKGAGIIKGYDDNKLVLIRRKIRELLITHQIKNDERYESESAHITFTRFRSSLKNPLIFCETMEKNMEVDLGEEEITNLELVEHDWYNSSHTKRIIDGIQLGKLIS
jgi:hypothetical protein